MNEEVRERENVMRGLKDDAPILKGSELCHSYVRTHEGLDCKTPAEKYGIKIDRENRWITLIPSPRLVLLGEEVRFG